MKRSIHVTRRRGPVLSAGIILTSLCLSAVNSFAAEHDTEDEETLAVSEIFFELNNTDGDLGIHGLIDGDPWKRLRIFDHHERAILDIRVKSRLQQQGLTEIFFESAEPPFESDDPEELTLLPEEFFDRFPEGTYEIETTTTEGDEQDGDAQVTHVIPAPPVIAVNGLAAASGCDEALPLVGAPVTISWDPVTESHPDIGIPGVSITVVNYEVVAEIDGTPFRVNTIVPSGTTEFVVPAELLNLSEGEIKFEVLVREQSFNQTAVESCFALL